MSLMALLVSRLAVDGALGATLYVLAFKSNKGHRMIYDTQISIRRHIGLAKRRFGLLEMGYLIEYCRRIHAFAALANLSCF